MYIYEVHHHFEVILNCFDLKLYNGKFVIKIYIYFSSKYILKSKS